MASREKFIELAEKRVTRAIKDLHLIGNLSNKKNYEYDDEDAKKIIAALENAVRSVKKKFEENSADKTLEFRL